MSSRNVPPYTITPAILNAVSEISELLGHWSAKAQLASPQLRKENRIRTIQASLAIEHNSLSTEQVTAIMDGKRVLGPTKDIQEVRNAILTYEKLSHWQSHNIDHLLEAHQLLMMGLVDISGHWRSGGVGVYRHQQLVHMAPPANQVHRLMDELLNWLSETDIHPLISSCIFHYEFEFIHPFADGNGRMGRLWQTLILSEWRTELAWLPVETLVCEQQEDYYRALGEADRASDCTCFIDFILQAIAGALREGITDNQDREMSENMSEKKISIAHKILTELRAAPTMTIVQLAEKLQVTTRTIERQLKNLQQQDELVREGSARSGHWRVMN